MHGILATIEEMMHTRRVKQRRLREAIGIIADCSDHLCTVINDILDFQTLGRHQIHLEKIEFNLAEQLEQVDKIYLSLWKPNAVFP
jgi:signal transduction histidine kinase